VARDDRGVATRMVGTMIDLTTRPMPASRGVPGADEGRALPLIQQSLPIAQIDDLLDLALRETSGR
jgi:hypothetical protein